MHNVDSSWRTQEQESETQFLSSVWWQDKILLSIHQCCGDQWELHFCKHSEFSEERHYISTDIISLILTASPWEESQGRLFHFKYKEMDKAGDITCPQRYHYLCCRSPADPSFAKPPHPGQLHCWMLFSISPICLIYSTRLWAPWGELLHN